MFRKVQTVKNSESSILIYLTHWVSLNMSSLEVCVRLTQYPQSIIEIHWVLLMFGLQTGQRQAAVDRKTSRHRQKELVQVISSIYNFFHSVGHMRGEGKEGCKCKSKGQGFIALSSFHILYFILSNILSISPSSFSPLSPSSPSASFSLPSLYQVLKKISGYIQEQNEKIYAPRGLLLTDPVERGMRVVSFLSNTLIYCHRRSSYQKLAI